MDRTSFRDTTAEDAFRLEDGAAHPLRENDLHGRRYFELLSIRRRLPASAKRQEFLDLYHQHQVAALFTSRRVALIPTGDCRVWRNGLRQNHANTTVHPVRRAWFIETYRLYTAPSTICYFRCRAGRL